MSITEEAGQWKCPGFGGPTAWDGLEPTHLLDISALASQWGNKVLLSVEWEFWMA